MIDQPDSCTRPVRGPILQGPADAAPATPAPEEVTTMTARVGQQAPDFEAMAYIGPGFNTVKLSDYAGEWIMLCFYPGDFTFV